MDGPSPIIGGPSGDASLNGETTQGIPVSSFPCDSSDCVAARSNGCISGGGLNDAGGRGGDRGWTMEGEAWKDDGFESVDADDL